jgi:CRISPR-associated endonuclease/helicase Cas3
VLRPGKLAAVGLHSTSSSDVVSAVAMTLHQQMYELHQLHHSTHQNGKTVSFG